MKLIEHTTREWQPLGSSYYMYEKNGLYERQKLYEPSDTVYERRTTDP